MVDLKNLEQRLNSDDQLRDQFLSDPVAMLHKEGLTVPAAAEASVRQLAAQAKSKLSTHGSSVAAAAPNAIEIKISIPI